MKSIRRHLFYKHNVQFQASEDPEQQRKIFEEDFERYLKPGAKTNIH